MSAAGGQAGGWTPARSVAGGRNPWTIIGVISIATFMVVLDTSIANVALAHIAGSVSASYDEATWVITSFLISTAIVIPISGWLADVVGRKRYYMISVALFTVSSLMCGLAPNLGFLVAARILQGIGGGGLAPVEQSMMVDTFPPAKRGAAFAAYGVVVIVGPVLGPSLGGWITDNLSWHWVFLINVPIGLLSLFLVSIFVEEPKVLEQQRKKLLSKGLRVDIIGFALVALFLGCLEITLDRDHRRTRADRLHSMGAFPKRAHREDQPLRPAQFPHRQHLHGDDGCHRVRHDTVHSAASAGSPWLHGDQRGACSDDGRTGDVACHAHRRLSDGQSRSTHPDRYGIDHPGHRPLEYEYARHANIV
jgi:multidrug resistance protein